MSRYEEYFDMQVGGGGVISRGGGGIGRIYAGSPYQKGQGGIGSFLAGVFRRVLPILTRGAKAVGKEALRTGMSVVSDVTTQNTPLREALRNRVRESGESLKRKAEEKLDKLMEGSGYKVPRYIEPAQLLQSLNSANIRSGRRKKRKQNKKCTSKRNRKSTKTRVVKETKKKKKKKSGNRSTRDIFG